MVWVRKDLKNHVVPSPLPWAGTPSTSCSKTHPTWLWTLPGRGHPEIVWETCASASPTS